MNKILKRAYVDFPIQLRYFISARIRELIRNKRLEKLVLFESLPEQYHLSATVLWDCLLALNFEPQKLNGQIYFTAGNLKRLEQFIKRMEIAWACPHILGTCWRTSSKSFSFPCSEICYFFR